MKDQSTKKDLIKIAIALGVLAIFIGINLYGNYKKSKEEFMISEEKQPVLDNSRYMTVINCINKFINYVQIGNKDNILLLLNEEYKNDYNVDVNNLNNFIPNLSSDGIYSYSGEEMYYKQISENVTEYYVVGNIEQTTYENVPIKTPYNITIVLYENKLVFSVKPGADI